MRVGRYIITSPTHHHFAWHPESFCGMSRNQLTSVNGENPGSRPWWSMHTSWTTPQSDNRALHFLNNNGLFWTVSALDKVSAAVPVRRNGNFQTPISVPVVRPKRCHTLLNSAHRQDYTVACLDYTQQTMMPLSGWPVMAPNAHNNNNYTPCHVILIAVAEVLNNACSAPVMETNN